MCLTVSPHSNKKSLRIWYEIASDFYLLTPEIEYTTRAVFITQWTSISTYVATSDTNDDTLCDNIRTFSFVKAPYYRQSRLYKPYSRWRCHVALYWDCDIVCHPELVSSWTRFRISPCVSFRTRSGISMCRHIEIPFYKGMTLPCMTRPCYDSPFLHPLSFPF